MSQKGILKLQWPSWLGAEGTESTMDSHLMSQRASQSSSGPFSWKQKGTVVSLWSQRVRQSSSGPPCWKHRGNASTISSLSQSSNGPPCFQQRGCESTILSLLWPRRVSQSFNGHLGWKEREKELTVDNFLLRQRTSQCSVALLAQSGGGKSQQLAVTCCHKR